MNNMINFGIDLGTTNSLIAKFTKGTVEVFKNPNGFKETLPSIVGFRNDRILVGEQARAYMEKDHKSVPMGVWAVDVQIEREVREGGLPLALAFSWRGIISSVPIEENQTLRKNSE